MLVDWKSVRAPRKCKFGAGRTGGQTASASARRVRLYVYETLGAYERREFFTISFIRMRLTTCLQEVNARAIERANAIQITAHRSNRLRPSPRQCSRCVGRSKIVRGRNAFLLLF